MVFETAYIFPFWERNILQTLGIIGDSVSNTAEDFRRNLQCILPVSRRASSLEGKARRNEKENGY